MDYGLEYLNYLYYKIKKENQYIGFGTLNAVVLVRKYKTLVLML